MLTRFETPKGLLLKCCSQFDNIKQAPQHQDPDGGGTSFTEALCLQIPQPERKTPIITKWHCCEGWATQAEGRLDPGPLYLVQMQKVLT